MKKTFDFALRNLLLFLSIILLICFTLLVEDARNSNILINIFFSLVLLAASSAIRDNRRLLSYVAMAIILFRVLSQFVIEGHFFYSFATIISVLFFLQVVYQLIRQVARSKEVDRSVILESINAYLLMGICGAIIFLMLSLIAPESFSLPGETIPALKDFMYYSYITQTTIGYGDITPVSNLARLLSLLLGIGGQLYLAIIIAMLVGKFLSGENRNKSQ